jgi:hypothetical protein
MTKLSVSNVPKCPAQLTYAGINDGQYGQEVVFEWEVREHPTIKVYTEKFNIGSEMYGEQAFERLQKVMKILTGREIDRDSDLEEEKLIGMRVWLSFGFYKGKDCISHRSLRTIDEPQQQKLPQTLAEELNDDIPF